MVSVLTVILIIILIFAIGIFFKLIKNVLKASIYVFVLLAILLFVGGIFIYTDATNFRKGVANEPLSFMLADGQELITGIKVIDFNDGNVLLLSNTTMSTYEQAYAIQNLDVLLDDSYKLFIFNISIVENMDTNLSYGGINLSSTQAVEIIRSDDPSGTMAKILADQQGYTLPEEIDTVRADLLNEFETDNKIKGAVFSMFVATLFPSETLNIVDYIKNDEIIIYPETAMFKAINYVPTSWLRSRGEENQSEVLEEE